MLEKKIKSSAENITLPEDAKKRIISKCAEIARTGANDNADYTDHIFTVERVKSHRIRRVVSGIAACALLAGGIGVTNSILHRQGTPNLTSDVNVSSCIALSPFGDFHTFDFTVDADDFYPDTQKKGEYSDEVYEQLAEYLTYKADFQETDDEPLSDESVYGKEYRIYWSVDDKVYYLNVLDSDFAVLHIFKYESGREETETKTWYKINFYEFSRNVCEIIDKYSKEEEYETDELTVNPNNPFGDFTKKLYTLVDYEDRREKGYTTLEYENISKFLNSFAWGEELHTTDHEGDGEIVISWFGEERDSVYVLGIRKNNTAIYYKRQPTDDEPYAKAFERYFSVDYNKFREGLEKNIESITPDVDSGQVWCDSITINLLNESYEPYYYSDNGEKTAMNMAMRYAVCDAISFAEWTEKQITNEEQVISNSIFCVSCSFPESDNTLYIYGLEDDTIAFRTDANKDDILYRCFKGDVKAMKEAIEIAMDTESQHDEDNAAYYLPGFNFEKASPLYIDPANGEQPLSEEVCSKLQDIFYGYNWNAHVADNIDIDNLFANYKFVVKCGDFERHLDICHEGYICLYDVDADGNKLGIGNNINNNVYIVYKFSYDTIYNKVLGVMSTDYKPQENPEIKFNARNYFHDLIVDYKIHFTIKDPDERSGFLTQEQAENIWSILDRFDWENEIDEKEFNYAEIKNCYASFSKILGEEYHIQGDTSILITTNGYAIVTAPDGHHIYRTEADAQTILDDISTVIS